MNEKYNYTYDRALVSKRLKQMRLLSGKSRENVAIATGVQMHRIFRSEEHGAELSYVDARKLANYYGCSVEYIYGFSDQCEAFSTNTKDRVKGTCIDYLDTCSIEDLLKIYDFVAALKQQSEKKEDSE